MQFEKTTKPTTELKKRQLLREYTSNKQEHLENETTAIQWFESIVNSLAPIGNFVIKMTGYGLLFYKLMQGELGIEYLGQIIKAITQLS